MSAIGPKESSREMMTQLENKGIKTSTCIVRKSPTPSSYIIQSRATGSRTIISNTTIEDITRDEFARKFEAEKFTETPISGSERKVPFQWIHFEGRNVEQAGDVVFFSKLFAERRGYNHPVDFLRAMRLHCKLRAALYCTWGSDGAACLQPSGEEIHAAAPQLSQVRDSVGAGDTFIGGVIATLLQGMSYLSSLEFACKLATCKVAQQGFDGLAEAMTIKNKNNLMSCANTTGSTNICVSKTE
ncbi:Ribokinase-like protein [Circinella umbellata]|nr:Ribokinase-like protein [Circinella umbellata]